MIVSTAGWLAAVASVALVLFVGKPFYFEKGYTSAREEQARLNIEAVDRLLASSAASEEKQILFGQIVSVQANALEIEILNQRFNNPLRKERFTQRLLITEDVVVEKVTLLQDEAYIQALEEGRSRGLTTDQIQLTDSEPLSIEDLYPGDIIQIIPATSQDLFASELTPLQIIYQPQTQNNFSQ